MRRPHSRSRNLEIRGSARSFLCLGGRSSRAKGGPRISRLGVLDRMGSRCLSWPYSGSLKVRFHRNLPPRALPAASPVHRAGGDVQALRRSLCGPRFAASECHLPAVELFVHRHRHVRAAMNTLRFVCAGNRLRREGKCIVTNLKLIDV